MARLFPFVLTLVLLFAALPLASTTGLSSIDAEQEDAFLVAPDTNLSIRPDGNGWGRIVFTATETTALVLELEHETIDVETGWGGRHLYDEHTYTFVQLFAAGTAPYSSHHWYRWWGTPASGFWPQGGWQRDADPIQLGPGDEAILVVADLVGGYTLHIRGDQPGTGETITWQTGPNPDFHLLLPEEQRTAEIGIESAGTRDRSWHAVVDVPGDVILMAYGWEQASGIGATFAMYSNDRLGWDPGTHSQSSRIWTLSTGYASLLSRTGYHNDPGPVGFYREIGETRIDTQGEKTGAQFLVLPLGAMD